MKRLWLVVLVASLVFTQGCVLGMAALIRWDHKRYKAQQEKLRAEEEGKSTGGGAETDGESVVPEVQKSSTGDKEQVEVSVQPRVVAEEE